MLRVLLGATGEKDDEGEQEAAGRRHEDAGNVAEKRKGASGRLEQALLCFNAYNALLGEFDRGINVQERPVLEAPGKVIVFLLLDVFVRLVE